MTSSGQLTVMKEGRRSSEPLGSVPAGHLAGPVYQLINQLF